MRRIGLDLDLRDFRFAQFAIQFRQIGFLEFVPALQYFGVSRPVAAIASACAGVGAASQLHTS